MCTEAVRFIFCLAEFSQFESQISVDVEEGGR